MSFTLTLEEFLTKAGYTAKDWEKSTLDWSQLETIAKHHDNALKTLSLHGGSIANRLQEFNGVHSVRWRVKDTFGLLKKILRKNLESLPKEKWVGITSKNYRSVVSDLIGVRALHLLKEDCFAIDEQIRETWNITDTSIFKRNGDRELTEIIERGAKEDIHDAGYRSIHYDFSYGAEKEPILVEVQVRTIFQEGWSEIDHKVKYPDFSENSLLIHYLDLFNGLSGTADDMGSFVIQLDQLIKTTDTAILEGEAALAARDSDIEALQQEINKLKSEGSASKTTIDSLQTSVDNIKEKNTAKSKTYGLAQILASNSSDIFNSKLLTTDPEYLKSISRVTNRTSSLAKLIDDLRSPNNELAKTLEQLRSPDTKLAKALEQLSAPNSALSKTLEQLSAPDSKLAKALEQLNSPNTKLAEVLAKLDSPNSAEGTLGKNKISTKPTTKKN